MNSLNVFLITKISGGIWFAQRLQVADDDRVSEAALVTVERENWADRRRDMAAIRSPRRQPL